MPVYRDEKNNTWKIYYRYTDWDGTTHQSTKRGFKTKRDAQAWEREQHSKSSGNLDMTFRSFAEQAAEVVAVGEAAGVGDVFHFHIVALQQHTGLFETNMV